MFVDTVLFVFALYHLVAGVSALGPQSWLKAFSGSLYALSVESSPALTVALKAIGLFALFTAAAFCSALLLGDEQIKAVFVFFAGLLTFARGAVRFFLRRELEEGYGLSVARNKRHIFFNSYVGLGVAAWGLKQLLETF